MRTCWELYGYGYFFQLKIKGGIALHKKSHLVENQVAFSCMAAP